MFSISVAIELQATCTFGITYKQKSDSVDCCLTFTTEVSEFPMRTCQILHI